MSNRGKDKVTPGKVIIIQGIKLTEQADSYWRDAYGVKYDVKFGVLYKELAPGRWVKL